MTETPAIKPTMNGVLGFCNEDCPYCVVCSERESFYKYECTKANIRMGVAEVCQPWALALVEKLKYAHPPRGGDPLSWGRTG